MNGEIWDHGTMVVLNQHLLDRLRQITTPLVRGAGGQAKTQTRHLLITNQKHHREDQLDWLPYEGNKEGTM